MPLPDDYKNFYGEKIKLIRYPGEAKQLKFRLRKKILAFLKKRNYLLLFLLPLYNPDERQISHEVFLMLRLLYNL